jgi:hypothetical protein
MSDNGEKNKRYWLCCKCKRSILKSEIVLDTLSCKDTISCSHYEYLENKKISSKKTDS